MEMGLIVSKMLMLLILLIIGYVCAKLNVTTKEFNKSASKVAINVFLTALIISSVANKEIPMSGGELVFGIGMMFAYMLISLVIAVLTPKVFRIKDGDIGMYELLIGFMNTAFIGYPVIQSIYGEEAVFFASTSGIPFNLAIYTIGIIMLTAKSQEMDKISGLMIGADDYITKPFSMEELLLRIEAILRRVNGKKGAADPVQKLGKFTFNSQKQLLTIDGESTKLTTKESELLALLCEHKNDILERNRALKTIWVDDNYFNARSMDVYITKLRKLLKADPQVEIINVHGKGYKIVIPEEQED